MTIDSRLNFNEHINNVCMKVSQRTDERTDAVKESDLPWQSYNYINRQFFPTSLTAI